MPIYKFSAKVTVSAYTEVEADTEEEARAEAESRDVVLGGLNSVPCNDGLGIVREE